MGARFRKLLARVYRRLTYYTRGEFPPLGFDIWNRNAVNRLLARQGVQPIRGDIDEASESVQGAIRFVYATVADRPELRRRFPDLFHGGVASEGARWFTGEGASQLGLPPRAIEHIRMAFASHPGEQGLRPFEMRADLREEYPLALTPKERGKFLRWAAANAERESGLTVGEVLWCLGEMDLRSDRGLIATYRFQPSWQEAVPDALSPAGWPKLKAYLATRYTIRQSWLGDATFAEPEPDVFAAARQGVNVHGHFDFDSGLQEVALGLVRALRLAGIPTALRDLPVLPRVVRKPERRYHDLERFDTTIFVAGLDTAPAEIYRVGGLFARRGIRRIAIWYWELEEVPEPLAKKMTWPDEVWAPTRFIAETFRKYVTVPVIPMLPGVELPTFERKPRSHFGLAPDRFVFLFTFDMFSTVGRKNPHGLIEAFRRAFAPFEPVDLVIKVSRGEKVPEDFSQLQEHCAAAGVQLRNEVLPRGELLALLDCCDCYVSLHRAEGLGLGLAETMLLGKPVIATGYSGNLDFMNDENSYLVRYERRASEVDHSPYPKGFIWADPDLDHAAERMRYVVDHPEEAAALGARAKAEVERTLAPAAYAERLRERLGPL